MDRSSLEPYDPPPAPPLPDRFVQANTNLTENAP